MSESFLPMFPSACIMFSVLKFKSLIHLSYFFLNGLRQGSYFILLHVVIQFSQHHLLKRLSFPHQVFLAPFSNISFPYMWGVRFWALDSVPLVLVYMLMPVQYYFNFYSFVIQFDTRMCAVSSFVLSQDCVGYLESFVVPYKLQDCFFYFC